MVLAATLTSGTANTRNVAVGFGALAGNVLLLLSLAWGGAVVAGRCDLDANQWQISRRLRNPRDLAAAGVSTDDGVAWQAWLVLASSALYAVIQVPGLFGCSQHGRCLEVAYATGAVLSFLALAIYCCYQAFGPSMQRRRGEARCQRHLRYNTVRSVAYYANRYGGILASSGKLNYAALSRIFQHFDRDKDGLLSREEVVGMLEGMDFAVRADAGQQAYIVDSWMLELDREGTAFVGEERFCDVMRLWFAEKQARFATDFPAEAPKQVQRAGSAAWWLLVRKAPEDYCTVSAGGGTGEAVVAMARVASSVSGFRSSLTSGLLEDVDADVHVAVDMSVVGASASEFPRSDSSASLAAGAQDSAATRWQDGAPASLAASLLGWAVCAALAKPFVQQLVNFSEAAGLHAFLVAYVVAPLAGSGHQLLTLLRRAGERKSDSISDVLRQVYASLVVTNTLCFGCLLLGLHRSGGTCWFYSTEVMLIVASTVVLVVAALRAGRTIPAALGCAMLAAYPAGWLALWVVKAHFDTLRA